MKIPYPFIKLAPKLAAKLEQNFTEIENAINAIDAVTSNASNIQVASNTTFGIVKPDGTSITAESGVIGLAANYKNILDNAVTMNTMQTISGTKTFSGNLYATNVDETDGYSVPNIDYVDSKISSGSSGGVTIETTSNGYTIKRYSNNWAEIYISVPASDIFKLTTETGPYINTDIYATPEIYFGNGIQFADANYFVYPCYGWTYVAGTDNYKYDNLTSSGTVSKNYYPLYRTTSSCQIRMFQVSGLSFTGAAQFICSGYLAS